MSQAFVQPRLHSLLDPFVGSEDEKCRRVTSDQEQGSDGSDDVSRDQHSRQLPTSGLRKPAILAYLGAAGPLGINAVQVCVSRSLL